MGLDIPPTVGPISGVEFMRESMAFTQAAQWSLLIIFRFSGDVVINGRRILFEPGTVIIVPPKSLVNIQRFSEPGAIFFLNFAPSPEAEFHLGVPMINFIPKDVPTIDSWLRIAIDRLLFNRVTVQATLWNLLLTIGKDLTEWEESNHVHRFRSFVEANLDRQFSVSEVADAIELSHNHMIRIVREELGVTPQQFIRETRMSRAAEMLVASPASIKEIAIRVGIPDLQRFNKLVRETFGVSPRTLRTERSAASPFRSAEPKR
ncbi:MAG: helix-turn-helix transcriptional regulator [Fimbriimonadaceae bacterium]|nr:helix-turn-helix transcriptional regulator [Fimbriimonadaceae bacterium]